ncbi:MAG: hypothetical protein WCY19_02210 [Candidatus Gastranaerophilaceae bacterium]
MVITFNPKINYSQKASFGEGQPTGATAPAEQTVQPAEKTKTTAKGFIAKTAYAWVNLAEGTKGVIKGLFAGFITGTAIAGADWLVSGLKNVFKPNQSIVLTSKFERFKNMFKHPKAQLGKYGKIVAPIFAGLVLVGNLIAARLKANKRTANVDHMLYEGHRDK